MSKLFNKVLNLVGFGEAEDEQELGNELISRDEEKQEQDFRLITGKKGKVVNIHTTAQFKVVVVQPENFEEARDIADTLKTKNPVVINLEGVEKEIARRIIDFLSGAVYSLDGNIQKVSNGIFLVTPYNVGIMGDFKDELRNKGVFPWNY